MEPSDSTNVVDPWGRVRINIERDTINVYHTLGLGNWVYNRDLAPRLCLEGYQVKRRFHRHCVNKATAPRMLQPIWSARSVICLTYDSVSDWCVFDAPWNWYRGQNVIAKWTAQKILSITGVWTNCLQGVIVKQFFFYWMTYPAF